MDATNASKKGEEDPAIKRLRARLNRWELQHLRQLAASLHEQLEEALSSAYCAERRDEMWQDAAEQLQGHMQASGSLPAEIGLTMQGELVLMSGCAQASPHGAKFSEAWA